MKNHLIIIDRSLNSKVGGGRGYLYKLKQGLEKVGADDFIVISKKETSNFKQEIKSKYKHSSIFNFLLRFYRILNAIRYYFYLCRLNKKMPSDEIIKEIEKYDFDSIHCHHPFEFIVVLNYLKSVNKKDVIKFLSIHDPGLTSKEIYNSFISVNKYIAKLLKNKTQEIEIEAFKNSDVLIFPCEESLNYYSNWKHFKSLIEPKNIGYVLTGTEAYKVTEYSTEYREKLKIDKSAIVFSFLGRHNEIKGYDVLKKAANLILTDNENIYFLIGGEEGPLYGLKNEKWIEVGFTSEPSSLVNASDVFIAPNRKAYFDLVIIEAMSIGKVVIATKTGGNIKIASLSDGVILVEPENPKALKEVIEKLAHMSKEELKALGGKNKIAFEKYFTLEKFANNYVNLVNSFKKVKNAK